MAYCDFCTCDACQNGASHLQHAQTEDGRWICSTCYDHDLCTSGPNRSLTGPCLTPDGEFNDPNCPHRPKIVTGWSHE